MAQDNQDTKQQSEVVKSNSTKRTHHRQVPIKMSMRMFSGPLPPPDILKEYNKVQSDAADRILTMAEIQAGHRREMEKIVVTKSEKRATIGQWFSGIASILSIVAGLLVALLGDKLFYGVVFMIPGGALIGASIIFRTRGLRSYKRRSSEDKNKE